jgi:hypothetical protein
MTSPILPIDGQTPWGDELNTGILEVNTTANNAEIAINNHASNQPADPHGDRAYAQSLVTPITTGVNQPNGFVKLNNSGKILASLVTGAAGGAFTNVYDAVAQYGVVLGNSADQSSALQSALTAAGNSGGGVVWVGESGSLSLANYVVIPNNTILYLANGVTLTRIIGSSTPSYLITNVQFGTSNTPSSNIKIIGGKIDAVGSGLTTACTPIFIIGATSVDIEEIYVNSVWNNPCIEFNGCSDVRAIGVRLNGTNKSSGSAASVPAIRINSSNTLTTPSGLASGAYNNNGCYRVVIDGCHVYDKSGTWGPFGGIVGTDLLGGGNPSANIFISNCHMSYNDNQSNEFSIFHNNQWNSYTVSNCILPENDNGFDSWNEFSLQNSWLNSNYGPVAQWRVIQLGSGGGSGNEPAIGNTIEIIGDIVASSTVSNGTVVAALPAYYEFNDPQIVSVQFISSGFSPSNGARFYFNNLTNQLQCENLSSASGQRMAFHAFLSTSA